MNFNKKLSCCRKAAKVGTLGVVENFAGKVTV